jgi:hypothetical protein
MSEIPRSKRSIILQYRFVDKYSWTKIASKIGDITANGARMFCERTQKRAQSSNIEDLLKEIDPLPRAGRPRRVEPGSTTSIRIREALRGTLRYHKQEEAGKIAYDRCRDTTANSPRKPLGELNAKQIHNIAQGQLHSSLDPVDQRPVTRKRALEKPALSKLNLIDRERYIEHILSLDSSTILISCDETLLEFGGVGHTHVSAPRGVVVYADQASDPCFLKI